MSRRQILVLATALGAAFGALSARPGLSLAAHVPALALDRSVLGHWQYRAAAVGWVLFSVYWEVAAKNATPATRSESRISRAFHVTLANAAALLIMVPIRGFGRFVRTSAAVMAAGLAVEAIGLVVAIWARHHLGRQWSGEITIKVDHELIRSGPYARLRHPIYTGILGMYIGAALVTGEWLAIAGLAMISFAYWRKIRLEEASLQQAFGAGYDAYRRESWALIPGLF
jgi:protein-S-isoprenylcysteine O-methyltransferase Ste14